jgi:superfamily II DNA or RNA helicase
MTETITPRLLQSLLQTLAGEFPEPTAFGAAFELVADLALWSSTEFGAQIEQIWRWEDWPDAEGRDCGIDRVVRTINGELWAVQAKGYAASTTLTYSGIATFLAASAKGPFSRALVVTSTDRIAQNAKKEVQDIRRNVPAKILDRSWLDLLDVEWPAGFTGLRNAAEEASRGSGVMLSARINARRELKPHQKAAVNDVLDRFSELSASADNARAKLLMPCGTGKTVTCHAVAEQLGAQQVLVLLPSLALVAQTMREWQAQAQGRLRVIAVCSDETVARGNDEIMVDPSELLAPVTTDASSLAALLAAKDGPLGDRAQWPTVVFSTYHSSTVVAEAQQLVPGHVFDLIVADEAHYLAGRVSKAFSVALDGVRLRARHRLFATATPRIVSTALKDTLSKDGLDHHLASMDDPAVFGPVAHELKFSEALDQGLLTDYEVWIIGVDSAEVSSMIDQRALVTVQGKKEIDTDAATLAAAVATYRAVAEHGARRLVSYHSRITRAEGFSRLLDTLPSWLPRDLRSVFIIADTVKGSMSMSVRRRVLRKLDSEGGRAGDSRACVIANARCLTEGVDIPALDGVVFVDPRGSRIDILQSVGRVTRLSPDKEKGLVIVPVVLDRSQDAEEALASSAFKRVWDVLGALRDHDDTLAEKLDSLRTALGRNAGSGAGTTIAKIRIDLPAWVEPEFAESIQLKAVEHTTSSWHYNFGLLQSFVEREGHARVPYDYAKNGVKLGQWVGVQRRNRKKLSSEQSALLETLPGWDWEPLVNAWLRNIAALRSFVAENGHARVPHGHMENGVSLATWVQNQRSNKAKLPLAKRSELESFPGWSWNIIDDTWEANYQLLIDFAAREGHAYVPHLHLEDGVKLGVWVQNQRRNSAMDKKNRLKLEAIQGWTWDFLRDVWYRNLALVQEFVKQEGHARVPVGIVAEGIKIGIWVSIQRKRREDLGGEQIRQLERLPGWTWDPIGDSWGKNYRLLEEFTLREGHAQVSARHIEGRSRLGAWVADQREKRDKLTVERQTQLAALPGWTWSVLEDKWTRGYTALESFIVREGHARVPTGHIEGGVKLGNWVSDRRKDRDKLTVERQAQLAALPGWAWSILEERWERYIEALREFIAREGHARVPATHIEGSVRLGSWVSEQRKHRDKLTPERQAQLAALSGWSWEIAKSAWEGNFEALRSFSAREGHARAPSGHLENGVALGSWVQVQRAKRAKLSPAQISLLEALPGWTWDPLGDDWLTSINALYAYVKREGHARVPSGHAEGGVKLGSWIGRRRVEKARGKLSAERIALFESFPGWSWNAKNDDWDKGYEALRKFALREGHCRIPRRHLEDSVDIGEWAASQRRSEKDGKLAHERFARLELLSGWIWDRHEDAWAKKYNAVMEFAIREGYSRVPQKHSEKGFRLGIWVSNQRANRDKLSAKQHKLLEILPGWTWKVQ